MDASRIWRHSVKVLVIGAAGEYAGHVVPALKQRGVTVRALVRDPGKVDSARRRGADEVVVGDLRNPANLRAAAAGMEGVFHINPAFAPDEPELGVAVVEAAEAAGVRKFVFSGVIHPALTKLVNHSAKLAVEEAMCESGMAFTILQPAMFMQTLEGGWKAVLERGEIGLPYSKRAKVCYVDYRDVAEVAARALTGEELSYGTFELCATGVVDRQDLAAIMSEALGRTIKAVAPPFEEWARRSGIVDGPTKDALKRMFAHYDAHGFPGGNSLVLRAILGREPRSLRQYVQELASRRPTE